MIHPRKTLGGAAIAWLALAMMPGLVIAANDGAVSQWASRVWTKILDPWFVFGMIAQAVFFARFVVQWIVSEKRKRSTVPIAFWYLSLLGGLLMLVYAIKIADPVILFGQALACAIYTRNLMFIYGRQGKIEERRRARTLQAELPEENGQGFD